MATRRVRKGEVFDSAFHPPLDVSSLDTPQAPVTSLPPSDPPRVSSADLAAEDELIAVAIVSAALRSQVHAALGSRGLNMGGPDVLADAAVVIVDSPADVTRHVAQVRRTARPDAALIVVLDRASAADVASAHAAGAFACVRPPLVPEEIMSFVVSALDSRAAKVQAADLARKLDLESHLASIGRVTSGLAHEIGNPLTVATMNLAEIREEVDALLRAKGLTLESMPALRDAIAETAAAHGRLHALIEAMNALVRKGHHPADGVVDVMDLIQQVLRWLGAELHGVQVEVIGGPQRARADATMLGQILHNLVANAIHAARMLPSPRLRLHVYASGDRVVASIRDNGPGIPVDLHDKIFEPFFTTRRGEGGTGLGLALCLEYALEMGADLSFWSLPQRGTCFRISMPRAP